jgi:hypothetical protein
LQETTIREKNNIFGTFWTQWRSKITILLMLAGNIEEREPKKKKPAKP